MFLLELPKIDTKEHLPIFGGHMKYFILLSLALPQLSLAETATELFKKANMQYCKISDEDYESFKKEMKNDTHQKEILAKYGINYGGDLNDAQMKMVNFTKFRQDADCIKLKTPSIKSSSIDKNQKALAEQYGEICEKFSKDEYEAYKNADAQQEDAILRSKAFRDNGYYKNKDKYSKSEITTALKVNGACERIKKYHLNSTPEAVDNVNTTVKKAGVDPSYKPANHKSSAEINDKTAATQNILPKSTGANMPGKTSDGGR